MSDKKPTLSDTAISVLDLVPVLAGKTPADSFKTSLDLAQHAEKWGYTRYWMAEHHNMPGIASSATSILIGHIAGGTKTIRVGSGGIMLPNHAPLVVAEQFGTLETLFPGRIDLGLGRAPGTDHVTAMALRRDLQGAGEDFPANLEELRSYLAPASAGQRVRAVPGEGLNIPIWLLGSSTFSAQLAGILGLPFAFASHFAPTLLHTALKIYRDSFQPSETLKEPYAMAGINVVAAETDDEARKLATSLYMSFLSVIRGTARQMQPPVDSMNDKWDMSEMYAVQQMLLYSFIGSPATVKSELEKFIESTGVDEVMVTSHIYDHAARLRSYEILAELKKGTIG
ncbi:LLM class flavin-dependent oxidoreductase [Pontibacter pudoricolor]|uniref:LLM class flavin-dependent oxidoreductase n=1 Tax=Pontibacter pudoricolor TaxID=2694930 RepID=UPI001390C8F3|nr:LLM class flavin-dependent oxidoreductase [Pontibacter pudoricolor]